MGSILMLSNLAWYRFYPAIEEKAMKGYCRARGHDLRGSAGSANCQECGEAILEVGKFKTGQYKLV